MPGDGVCLLCGDGVLNSGEHIDPERHSQEVERVTSGSRQPSEAEVEAEFEAAMDVFLTSRKREWETFGQFDRRRMREVLKAARTARGEQHG